jgi:hypothetical protein
MIYRIIQIKKRTIMELLRQNYTVNGKLSEVVLYWFSIYVKIGF